MSISGNLISVILPVYNGVHYLQAAIESILKQSYSNFELIIINDGSTDDSERVINLFSDSRIRYYQQNNCGLSATLNRGIELAKGAWIARQDQDDVSFPNRLELQFTFLEEHPDYAMVGSLAEIFIDNERVERMLCPPSADGEIRAGLLFYNYFVHSSVMAKKSVLESEGGYSTDPIRQPPEDYELWSRIARKYKVANLPVTLLTYREVASSMSHSRKNPFLEAHLLISSENIAWALNQPQELKDIQALSLAMQKFYPKGWGGLYGWINLRRLLLQAIEGLVDRCDLSPIEVEGQKRFLLKQLIISYLNFLSGGIFNRLLTGKVRIYLKRILNIPS